MNKPGKSIASRVEKIEDTPSNAVVPFLQQTMIEVGEALYRGSAYVQFAHPNSNNYQKLAASCPGLETGDPVLVHPAPKPPERLEPFRYFLVAGKRHYSEFDNGGFLVRSTFDADKARADPVRRGQPGALTDCVEAVLLVITPSGLVPVTCGFKGPKVNGIAPAIDASEAAAMPGWGNLSAEHKASLVVPDPRFRFTVTVRLKGKTARSSGNPYHEATGTVRPSGAADWAMVGEFFKDKGNEGAAIAAFGRYKDRLDEIKSKEF